MNPLPNIRRAETWPFPCCEQQDFIQPAKASGLQIGWVPWRLIYVVLLEATDSFTSTPSPTSKILKDVFWVQSNLRLGWGRWWTSWALWLDTPIAVPLGWGMHASAHRDVGTVSPMRVCSWYWKGGDGLVTISSSSGTSRFTDYSHPNLNTPMTVVQYELLIQKLTVAHNATNFSAFYGIRPEFYPEPAEFNP